MILKNLQILTIYLLIYLFQIIAGQHENIPYAKVENICETCNCLTTNDQKPNKFHHILDCNNKGLAHILPRWPTEFGANHMDRTIQVTFSENQIPLLQQLPATVGMISFSCRHCQINEIQVPTFIDCPNMYRLDLSWNLLTGDSLTPDIFRGPYNETSYETIALQELDISYNQISALDLRIFEHIPGLRILNLAGNLFEQIDIGTMDAIRSAKNLEYLDLSGNKLKILPDGLFENIPKLQSIFIQGNYFQSVPKAIKKIAGSLHTLDISSNTVQIFNESSFNNLVHLKFLNISGMNSLEIVDVDAFSTLTNLEELFCSNNGNLSIMHLPNSSTKLKTLDISNCNLKSVNLDHNLIQIQENDTSYQLWPNIRNIHLLGNPWHCDCNLDTIFRQYYSIFATDGNERTRCSSPYQYSGSIITDLIRDEVCKQPKIVMVHLPSSKLPFFLRPRYLAITIVLIAFTIALGTIVGFGIVFIKRKLRKDIFSMNTGEIRYTTVRNI